MRRLPPLTTLEAFEALVAARSTVATARELHLTHGAVSKKIRQLEEDLGCRLFERTPRGMTPTAVGLRFADAVGRCFDTLESGAREAVASAEATAIVLSCEPTLLIRWLIPRLHRLTEDTGIELSVRSGGGPIDLRHSGVDAAIRRSDFEPAHRDDVRTLVREFTGPVCAPGLLSGASPDEAWIADNVAIRSRTRTLAWVDWLDTTGRDRGCLLDTQDFAHHYEALAAAEAGLGVFLAPYVLAADALAAGALVSPFGFADAGTTYDLHSPDHGPHRATIETLAAWLCAHLPSSS